MVISYLKIYNYLRILGIIIVGIAISLILILMSLSQTVIKYGEELHKNCPLPVELCPFKRGALPTESIVGFIAIAALVCIGLYLLFIKPKEGSQDVERFKRIVKGLHGDEKKVYEIIMREGGSIFQSDLVLKSGYSKVKVSRILDRLEVKGLVERRRRGMANLVILK